MAEYKHIYVYFFKWIRRRFSISETPSLRKIEFPSKFSLILRNSFTSPFRRRLRPSSPNPTIFTFARRRADRKSIHLGAKSGTRNRFRASRATRQFPTTIPLRFPRGREYLSIYVSLSLSHLPLPGPPPTTPGGHVTCSKKRRRHHWRRNIAPCRHIAFARSLVRPFAVFRGRPMRARRGGTRRGETR